MLEAIIFILIGFWLARAWNATLALMSQPFMQPSEPRYPQSTFRPNFQMLGMAERLRRHYRLPRKSDVFVVAIQLLDRHSRAERASFLENGEWKHITIGPKKGA